jgi:pimeloyl-ACP methyl ester carboxylesterase
MKDFKKRSFTSHFFKIKTEYFDSDSVNKDKKPVIVFIHGGMASPEIYEEILVRLKDEYRVIAPAIPGFSDRSYVPEFINLNYYAYYFKELIEKLKINKYSLIGHSMGGGISLLLASIDSKVQKVVASNSAGYPLDYSALRLAGGIIASAFNNLGIFKKIQNEKVKEHILSLLKKKNSLKILPISTLNGALNALKKDYSKELKKIKCPVLLIFSNKDQIFDKKNTYNLKKLIKNSKLLSFKGDHDWLLHSASKFVKATVDFLKDKK